MEQFIDSIKELKPSIMARMEELQKQLHVFSEIVMKDSPTVEYQDAVVTFMLLKISELKEDIKMLIRISDN